MRGVGKERASVKAVRESDLPGLPTLKKHHYITTSHLHRYYPSNSPRFYFYSSYSSGSYQIVYHHNGQIHSSH